MTKPIQRAPRVTTEKANPRTDVARADQAPVVTKAAWTQGTPASRVVGPAPVAVTGVLADLGSLSEGHRGRAEALHDRARALTALPLVEREAGLKALLGEATSLVNDVSAELRNLSGDGVAPTVNLGQLRAELSRLARPSTDQVLTELRDLAPDQRERVLKGLAKADRDLFLGDTAFDPTRRDVGAPYEFDFGSYRASRSFDGNAAWGMAVLAKRAYEPREVVVPELEKQGYTVTVLGNDPPDGYLAIKGDQALLTFRGTIPSRWEDVKTDLKFVTTEGVHTGFLNKSREVWPQLSAALAAAQRAMPEGQKVSLTVTGHSLGAAVGTLAAEQVHRELGDVVSVDAVYTYGSPRLFKDDQARRYTEALGERTYRLVKNTDIVTTMPPELNLTHVGQRLFIDPNGVIKPGATDGAIIKSRLVSPFSSLLSGSGGEAQFLPWAYDHSPQGYVKNTFVETNRAVDLEKQRDEHLAYWLSDRQPLSVALCLSSMSPAKREAVDQRYRTDPIYQQAVAWLTTGKLPFEQSPEQHGP